MTLDIKVTAPGLVCNHSPFGFRASEVLSEMPKVSLMIRTTNLVRLVTYVCISNSKVLRVE